MRDGRLSTEVFAGGFWFWILDCSIHVSEEEQHSCNNHCGIILSRDVALNVFPIHSTGVSIRISQNNLMSSAAVAVTDLSVTDISGPQKLISNHERQYITPSSPGTPEPTIAPHSCPLDICSILGRQTTLNSWPWDNPLEKDGDKGWGGDRSARNFFGLHRSGSENWDTRGAIPNWNTIVNWERDERRIEVMWGRDAQSVT